MNMIDGIDLQNAKISSVLNRTEKTIITAIVETKEVYYVIDLISNTNMTQYYLFSINNKKIKKFKEKNNRLFLYPDENQDVYKIKLSHMDFNNYEILDICDPMKIDLSFYNKNWLK